MSTSEYGLEVLGSFTVLWKTLTDLRAKNWNSTLELYLLSLGWRGSLCLVKCANTMLRGKNTEVQFLSGKKHEELGWEKLMTSKDGSTVEEGPRWWCFMTGTRSSPEPVSWGRSDQEQQTWANSRWVYTEVTHSPLKEWMVNWESPWNAKKANYNMKGKGFWD